LDAQAGVCAPYDPGPQLPKAPHRFFIGLKIQSIASSRFKLRVMSEADAGLAM
jgi:hypothetical protein